MPDSTLNRRSVALYVAKPTELTTHRKQRRAFLLNKREKGIRVLYRRDPYPLTRQIEHEDIVVPHSHGAAIPAAVGQSITGRERERCTQFRIAVGKDALANATVTLPDLGVRDSTATSRSG